MTSTLYSIAVLELLRNDVPSQYIDRYLECYLKRGHTTASG